MSVFDPLGMLTPFTVKAKILLQEVWREKIAWDAVLSDVTFAKWKIWLTELKNLSEIRIPRWYRQEPGNRELHIFCDASEKAYAAVAYLVSGTTERRRIAFVASKSRVAPLKAMTIPRMELMAAVIGSRLATTIRHELTEKIQRLRMWSDSKTVIQWIRNDPRKYHVFVAHRLGEIDEQTEISDWRWLPTTENVADEGTRDREKSDLSQSSRWFEGPAFLREAEDKWPSETEDEVHDEELRYTYAVNASPNLVNWQRFSSWNRLARSMAYALRFIDLCRHKTPRGRGTLSMKEIERAIEQLVRQAQRESFSAEVTELKQKKAVDKTSRLVTLSPRLDDNGLLIMDGRLANARQVASAMKRPNILCPKHRMTQLMLADYHRKSAHQGQETVLNNVRQKYWVLGGRSAVRRTARECGFCRIRAVKPVMPQMGQLPPARLEHHVRPFTNCGLDYFGPCEVSIGRRKEKRYGALFTCLATRAVHVELASSLSADSAIQAIVRMTARRGWPKAIYSDNGTNFHGAERELREALAEMDQEKITDGLSARNIEWHFNPPSAPHMSGSWERLVGSIKRALSAILKEQAPREETLTTAIAEAEFTINSRPITHVSGDPKDNECLTPNHFLIGQPTAPLSMELGLERENTNACLRRQWRICQVLANQFWRRWVKEYLPSLARRTKWHSTAANINISDLVVIAEPNAPRNTWSRGKVSATYPGKDGQTRVVDVTTATGRTLRRPVAKVAVILATAS